MMKRLKIILAATVMVLLSSTTSGVFAQDSASPDFGNAGGPTPEGFWINDTKAIIVDIAYKTRWGSEPHYAAFFTSAQLATGQKYVGPSGNNATCSSSAGCISQWDWHGAPPIELLLPKGAWLLPQWFNRNHEVWQAGNYEANLFIH